MKFRQHSLRKAAILIASLDSSTAELLLEQMGPQQADDVRRAILRLSEVDPTEQNEIIEEFFRIGPLMPQKHPPGIELNDDSLRSLSLVSGDLEATAKPAPKAEPARDEPPFRFLQETEFETLAPFLKREHPQTIAVVLSHLPPDRAGEILARLPATAQVDVIRRLVDLDEADPQVLREVERELESWLSQQVRDRRRRAAGLAAVSAILAAAPGTTRRNILKNLSRHDRPLAGKLRPDRFGFADLIELDDTALVMVFKAADPELIVLALAGAPVELVKLITERLPIEQGRALSKALVHLGPTRLADVEEAQQALADLAIDLEAEGRISLGTIRKISLAA
jgi:flagellar motor switch protein FliG